MSKPNLSEQIEDLHVTVVRLGKELHELRLLVERGVQLTVINNPPAFPAAPITVPLTPWTPTTPCDEPYRVTCESKSLQSPS